MLDEKEIKAWIARLETEESSWSNYQKLASLYMIQNQHKSEAPGIQMYSASAAPEPISTYGDSDFLRAVSGKDPERAWEVIDELMENLRVVNERIYNNVMRKLQAI